MSAGAAPRPGDWERSTVRARRAGFAASVLSAGLALGVVYAAVVLVAGRGAVTVFAAGLLVGALFGCAWRARRVYKRGVRAGRISEANAHGVVVTEMHRMVSDWGVLDRQRAQVPPLVTRDITPTREDTYGGAR